MVKVFFSFYSTIHILLDTFVSQRIYLVFWDAQKNSKNEKDQKSEKKKKKK